jgi:hypothetical protein
VSLIYVSHPYGGKEENKIKVEDIVRTLAINHSENTYVSPIHTFGFLYNVVSYEAGLEYCFNLLDVCDKMLVFGDYASSRGCTAEILYCQEHYKPYEIVG